MEAAGYIQPVWPFILQVRWGPMEVNRWSRVTWHVVYRTWLQIQVSWLRALGSSFGAEPQKGRWKGAPPTEGPLDGRTRWTVVIGHFQAPGRVMGPSSGSTEDCQSSRRVHSV